VRPPPAPEAAAAGDEDDGDEEAYVPSIYDYLCPHGPPATATLDACHTCAQSAYVSDFFPELLAGSSAFAEGAQAFVLGSRPAPTFVSRATYLSIMKAPTPLPPPLPEAAE
jgi:hypothetical protein